MAEKEPVAELELQFSSDDASLTPWTEARERLATAKVYWLSTVRPDGRPHITPIAAVWLDDALFFTTGQTERKAKNLALNSHCVITTGCNVLEGLDLVVEGAAVRVTGEARLERLAQHFTVINYDRRGRGDSGDTAPYAVEREIEDLGALIAEAGGTASVYGHSSSAGLVLHAAAYGLPITRVVLHEPPYVPDGDAERRISQEYAENLKTFLAEGRRGDAEELFMTTVGMPPEMVDQMRHEPTWAGLEAIAPTLAYDSEVMGDISRGGTIPVDLVRRVTPPSLVLCGGASPAWMIDIGRQVADALPNGRHMVLEGQEHVVAPELLVPVLAKFFAD